MREDISWTNLYIVHKLLIHINNYKRDDAKYCGYISARRMQFIQTLQFSNHLVRKA